jgi:SAM-dependent methyltransferase
MKILKNGELNLPVLSELAQKPALFAPGESLFWDDPHISKGMLEAHLNPTWDAASRKHQTIAESVNWILSILNLAPASHILDLGCGPGLYCTRFFEQGFKVTGIDYSKRSIEYARQYARENSLDIEYIYQNYLEIDYQSRFEAITLIYCDFCVLPDEDRNMLLVKINKALKPGGFFVFDVHTPQELEGLSTDRTWDYAEAGFWKPNPHLTLSQTYVYPEDETRVNQYIVIEESGKLSIYRNWIRCYTLATIRSLLQENGFRKEGQR